MDKSNFKKLALMGIAGMLTATAQAPAHETAETTEAGTTLAGHGCGGASGGCGGRPSSQSNYQQIPQSQPIQQADNQYYQQQPSYASCNGRSQPIQQGNPQNNYQPSYASCGGRSQPQNNINSWNAPRYTADATQQPQTMQQRAGRQLTESELLSQLNSDTKAMYQGMDQEGKAMALRLANESADKNEAVRLAAKRITEKRAMGGSKYNTPY